MDAEPLRSARPTIRPRLRKNYPRVDGSKETEEDLESLVHLMHFVSREMSHGCRQSRSIHDSKLFDEKAGVSSANGDRGSKRRTLRSAGSRCDDNRREAGEV